MSLACAVLLYGFPG